MDRINSRINVYCTAPSSDVIAYVLRGEMNGLMGLVLQMQTEARGWAAQTRTAVRATVQRLLTEVDEVKRESLHQQCQLKQLAEDRRGLQSQLLQMVSRTELSEAMAELGRERESKSALRERLQQQQQENETLASAVQVGRHASFQRPFEFVICKRC